MTKIKKKKTDTVYASKPMDERKLRCFAMMSDGVSYRDIQTETGVLRGTLSKWRRSNAFARYHADRTTGPDKIPQTATEAGVEEIPQAAGTTLDEQLVRGKFLQACQVGGLAWAQAYSEATDAQTAQFLRELDTRKAHAAPRVHVLNKLLAIALDEQEKHPVSVRQRALVDWWKIVEGDTNARPLVQIDLGSGGQAVEKQETPMSVMLESIRGQLDKAKDLDLMIGVKPQGIEDIEDAEVEEDDSSGIS
tara:strand:- start:9339 stop:10085 length:747 start_codon:yes stop_codon:yes gene_type:complete